MIHDNHKLQQGFLAFSFFHSIKEKRVNLPHDCLQRFLGRIFVVIGTQKRLTFVNRVIRSLQKELSGIVRGDAVDHRQILPALRLFPLRVSRSLVLDPRCVSSLERCKLSCCHESAAVPNDSGP